MPVEWKTTRNWDMWERAIKKLSHYKRLLIKVTSDCSSLPWLSGSYLFVCRSIFFTKIRMITSDSLHCFFVLLVPNNGQKSPIKKDANDHIFLEKTSLKTHEYDSESHDHELQANAHKLSIHSSVRQLVFRSSICSIQLAMSHLFITFDRSNFRLIFTQQFKILNKNYF